MPTGQGPRICIPPRWWLIAGLLAAAVSLVVYDGYRRTSAGPAEGAQFDRPGVPSTQPARLRVATFNVNSMAADERGKNSRGRVALAIRQYGEFDFIGLNEVRADQASLCGGLIRMPYLFAASERRWWRDDFGNVALCALPVDGWVRVPLVCTQARGFRNVLVTRVKFGEQVVTVLSTHVDRVSDGDRVAQLDALRTLFFSTAEPCVLLGDLNTESNDSSLARISHAAGVVGIPESTPHQIDWIFARGLGLVTSGSADDHVSDHPFYWAEWAVR